MQGKPDKIPRSLNDASGPISGHPSIALVHLLWQGTPVCHFEDFLASYDKYPVGQDHELLLLFKGCSESQKSARLRAVGTRKFKSLDLPDGPSDLLVYFMAAEQTEYDFYCFSNSFSIIRTQDWLYKLVNAMESNEKAGVVGCSGSWEQNSIETPFPNYHIRTNGFLVSRDLLLSLDRGDLALRAGALAFESGSNGLTRQVLNMGLEPLVVDEQGKAWPKEQWNRSDTFRSGGQSGLMLQDNRTRAYDDADPITRQYLETMAWTDRDPGPNPMKRHKLSYYIKKFRHWMSGADKKRFPG